MNAYCLTPTNLPERLQRTVEPILMRVTKAITVSYVKPTIVRFEPQRFRVITCTKPMVYGVNDPSPRRRMRRDAQLHNRRMPTDRYEVIPTL